LLTTPKARNARWPLAERDDISINQFIATAVAEKAAALLTVDYLEARARQDRFNAPKETRHMTGIHFITDEKGRKTAAIIDLKKHKALWEDIEDVLVSRSRRHEKRIPLEKVKADLIKSGKLHG
jgi:hypothetical protein